METSNALSGALGVPPASPGMLAIVAAVSRARTIQSSQVDGNSTSTQRIMASYQGSW